jgi:HEAT repeat protein
MSSVRLDYLKSQLKHPLPTVRFNAVRSLGELDTEETIELLIDVLNTDISQGVRDAAALVLHEKGLDETDFASIK